MLILFKSEKLRWRLISLSLTLIAIGLSYNGLNYNTANLKGNIHLNYLIGYAIEAPSCLLGYFLLPR